MHKTRKRTLILSLASATAGFALPSCGDSSETNTTSTTDAGHEAAQTPGIVIPPVGSTIAPPLDASDEEKPVIMGTFVVPPVDAGDAGDGDPGVVVHPTDASDARPFPGVVINPQDGSARG